MSVTRSIPWTFVRLKLRLLRNRARSTRGGRAQLLASTVIAGVFLLVTVPIVIGATHDSNPQVPENLLVVGGTALVLLWTLLPLLAFGSDETVDPARLTLFPLAPKPLMGGMVLSSLLGPAPSAVLALVVVAAAGAAHGAGALLAAPVAVVLVVLAVTCARTVSTLLAAALTSRRGRDLAIVIAALLALTAQAVRFVRIDSVQRAGGSAVNSSEGVLRWLPPGMAGHALVDAGSGRILVALLELLPAVAMIVILLRVWARALDRSMTVVVDGETNTARKRRPDERSPLLFPRLRFIRPTPWGAVAAKELRYALRDPRRKVNLINATIIGVVGPVLLATRAGHLRPDSVLIASLCGYVALLGTMNQFGFDRGALWMDVAAGDVVQDELIGKNLATCTAVGPLLAVVGVGLAAASGGWVYVPATWLLGAAGLGAGLGIANAVSVRFPVRLPESRSPFGGQGGGQGCTTTLIVLGCTLVQNLAIAPVAIATLVAVRIAPASLVVVAPLCAAYGAAVWLAGLRIATATGRRRQPELLQAVDPAQSDR